MISRKWYKKSEMFKDVAYRSKDMGHFDMSCFCAQQAIEFFLKGLIIEKFNIKPYTHPIHE